MTYEEAVHLSGTLGLVLFLIAFAGVLYYALRPRNRSRFEQAARLPLSED